MMWESLRKLRDLPSETKVYCAHEYTLHNSKFALLQEPDNKDLQSYVNQVEAQREQGLATVPTTIAQERLVNPFLCADVLQLKKALGMEKESDIAVFTELRRRRITFRSILWTV